MRLIVDDLPEPDREEFERDVTELERVELAYGSLPRTELVRLSRKYGRSPETINRWRRGRLPRARLVTITDEDLVAVAYFKNVKDAWRDRRTKGVTTASYHTYWRAWRHQVDPAVRVGILKTIKEARKHQIYGRFPVGARGSMYQADSSMADTYVWSSRRKKNIRPWHVLIEDVATRVAFMVVVDTAPNADAVIAAFADATVGRELDGTFIGGIADVWKTDNGRDYVAKETKLVAARLAAIQVVCQPYKPFQKGAVESALKTLIAAIRTRCPGRVQRDGFGQRQPWHEEDGPLLTFEEYAARSFEILDSHLTERLHPTLGMTPLEAWRRSTTPIRRLVADREDQLAQLFLRRDETRRVSKDGIRLRNRDYWHDALLRVTGEEVTLGYSDTDPGFVYVFRGKEFLCKAPDAAMVDAAHGRALRRRRESQERIIARAERGAARLRRASGTTDTEVVMKPLGSPGRTKARSSGRERARKTYARQQTPGDA